MKLMLFLGAGVSVPSGLPTAEDLTKRLFVSRPAEDITTKRAGERALLYKVLSIARRARRIVAGIVAPGPQKPLN